MHPIATPARLDDPSPNAEHELDGSADGPASAPKRRARPRIHRPAAPRSGPEADPPTPEEARLRHHALAYTPEQAADLLNVPAAWLRRAAGQGRIPATYLGKHLRFSNQDLAEIIAAGRRPASRT
jgi:excisionase family DNA binding protein